MSRFIIQNKDGRFYTGNAVLETVYVPRPGDPTRNDPVARLAPEFETLNPLNALKYEESSDAEGIFRNPNLADPKAFVGCKVLETEFNSKNPTAIR